LPAAKGRIPGCSNSLAANRAASAPFSLLSKNLFTPYYIVFKTTWQVRCLKKHIIRNREAERLNRYYCSQARNALNCAFRKKMYSLKSKNPFAKQILHGFLPVAETE